ILITQFAPISKHVINRGNKLKLIGVLRAGIENVNYKYAESKSIDVLNTPGRSITSVSEFAVGMILSEMRNIARSNYKLKRGIWENHSPNGTLAPDQKESVVGLVGYGYIGQKADEHLTPFGCNILLLDKYFNGKTSDQEVSDLEKLESKAHVVSMHYRLTNKKPNKLNEPNFNLMKKNA